MRKQRYNLDDLFQQLREQQIGSVHEVSFAYLEPSGNLIRIYNRTISNLFLHSFPMVLSNIDILSLSEKRKNGLYKKSEAQESTMFNKFFIVHLKMVN